MLMLVLSDLHLGRGKFLKSGQPNILEDFVEDERFVEFLEYHRTGEFIDKPVHLVLAGDILNLIQIDIDGIFDHIVDEDQSLRALDLIAKGHPEFFKALGEFANTPAKKVTYLIGNHDAAMAFPRVQERFRWWVKSYVDFAFELQECGVHVEHGHRFEVINTVAPTHYFMPGPNGTTILNLPWGSLFCISVMPKLKKERPLIDRVRPMSAYITWCFLHDFFFFWRMAFVVVAYFIRSNFGEFTKQNRNFKTTLKLLKQITIYPRYSTQAFRIIQRFSHIHTVVMGHTHVLEWRRFQEGKFYFNSGTWNSIPSLDAGVGENSTKLSYVSLELVPEKNLVVSATLNEWQGHWRPYRSQVQTSYTA